MANDGTAPDTIVLIHGFWVTPRSWEDWKAYYEGKGYTVLTPGYPGFDVEVEALNEDPAPVAELTVPKIVTHLEEAISGLDKEPILMGHSAGGVFTQLLMDRGTAQQAWHCARRARGRADCRGRRSLGVPVLKNPANRHKAVSTT
jgi:esterase/lipase